MLIGMVVRTYYGLLNGSEATDGDDDGNVRGLKNKTRGRIQFKLVKVKKRLGINPLPPKKKQGAIISNNLQL